MKAAATVTEDPTAPTRTAVTPQDLAMSIQAAAMSVPGVRAVASTGPIETATLFPGGKVTGVRTTGTRVEVHLVVERFPVTVVAEEVRTASRIVLLANGDHRGVDVVVGDVVEAALGRTLEG